MEVNHSRDESNGGHDIDGVDEHVGNDAVAATRKSPYLKVIFWKLRTKQVPE